MELNKIIFTSLDRYTSEKCDVYYPKNLNNLTNLSTKFNYIAQGSGLSYTAAGFNSKSIVVKMSNFNNIGEIDRKNNLIKTEAGVTLFQLYNFLIVHGFIIRALPGYYNISVGGIIAGNTHGKNHYKNGCFYNFVESIELFHPKYGIVNCSRDKNKKLFDLTIGGFGLTGIIISSILRIEIFSEKSTESISIYMPDLKKTISSIYSLKDEVETIMSWNNFSQSSSKFGEGALMYSIPSQTNDIGIIDNPRILNPHREILNIKLFNRFTIPIINKLFLLYTIYSPKIKNHPHYQTLFPWHNKLLYFYGYGKNGFIQHQVLIPHENVDSYFEEFKYIWKQNYVPIFFTLFKLFKGDYKYLAFDGSGMSFTIDIINDNNGLRLLKHLDKLNIKYKCITNILKDSRLESEVIVKQFQNEYFRFKTNILEYDPNLIFRSNLTDRIGITI